VYVCVCSIEGVLWVRRQVLQRAGMHDDDDDFHNYFIGLRFAFGHYRAAGGLAWSRCFARM